MMKDYYEILEIDESANPEEIKGSFRRLAFEYHPDKNPGNERQAEEKFKEINEAYGVLGNETRRREYDALRSGGFAGVGHGGDFRGFSYSQEEIFRSAFGDGAIFDELNRMFAQAGLRFDEDFLNQVFFSGRGFRFQSFSSPSGTRRSYYAYYGPPPNGQSSNPSSLRTQQVIRKPNFAERLMGKAIGKLSKYALKKAFGIDLDKPLRGEDIYKYLKISSKEAQSGCVKKVRYKRGGRKTTLEVTVPPGVASGNKIKLKGVGEEGMEPGDLYLLLKIK